MNKSVTFALAVLSITISGSVSAQSETVRLWNLFTGQSRCLDVINDNERNKLIMDNCGKFSGQQWTLMPAGGAATVRLQNNFSGPGLCLDVINDDSRDKVIMAECGKFSGQIWTVATSPYDPRFLALSNQFTGPQKCLDIVNDEQDVSLIIADCGNTSGQFWVSEPSG